MPYIRKNRCVYRKDTGKSMGCSKTSAKAKAHIKALYANVEDEEDFDSIASQIISNQYSEFDKHELKYLDAD
jgi:predicted Mrr-cat superfamily restriction endonuclease